MPELPEVETIRRGLAKVIVGKKIADFHDMGSKVVKFETKDIVGATVIDTNRRAKILILGLNNQKSILIHLKMTGQLIWEDSPGSGHYQLIKRRVAGGHPSEAWTDTLPNKHTRAVFYFDDGSALFFNDLRKFGYLKLYPTDQLSNISELKKLGPEPFSSDFTVEYLMKRAEKVPNRTAKQFIMDQEIISGVGNIYADESLFYARIRPTRPVKDISKKEWEGLRQSIIRALELGLRYGGASEENYVDAFGKQGKMTDHTNVYHRTGEPCPENCGGVVERIKLGGRSTHFCPKCQA